MARIKVNKEKRGLYLTIGGRRVKIPYRDMKLLRETIGWRLVDGANPTTNFQGFSIKMGRNGDFTTKITLYTPRKQYVGTILDMTLMSL